MRHQNILISVFCIAAFGLLILTSCEGGDLYKMNAPDWITQKIDSIENSKNSQEEPLVGMQEDVYTIGATDFSSGWWQSFSKYYVVPDGKKWNAVFNLNLNPNDNTYYKNFALVVTNDIDRGGDGYTEYGAIRFDATGDSATYNSQWGQYLFFKYTNSTQLLSPDANNIDANVQKLGGKITLTVDRSRKDSFVIKMTNGTVTKTYVQPYKLRNLNPDVSDTNIRCFLCVEGSYINFLQTNIVPIGGLTSAKDKAPVSMILQNVPSEVDEGTLLNDAMSNVSAVVTYEEGVTKIVPASELYFSAIPDMNDLGEKNLVVIYNKTFKGDIAVKPIVASAKFNVVSKINSIKVTQNPVHTQYYFFNSEAVNNLGDRSLAFNPTGLEVTATYANGKTSIIDNSKLSFSSVPAKAGNYSVTITTANGKTTKVNVTVSESKSMSVIVHPSVLGAVDNTTAFATAFSDPIDVPAGETRAVSFTNYSDLKNNWDNFVVELRGNGGVYGDVRADNYGWPGQFYDACIHNGTQGDWATWLSTMNGAKVTVYVTNCNNGTADIQAVMKGTDGNTYTQYYLGLSEINPNDLNFVLTVDHCHLAFATASASRYYHR